MCSHVDRLHVPASTVLWKIKPSVQVKHNSMRSNFLLPLKNSLCSPAFSLRSDPHERSLVVKKMGEMFTAKKNEDKRIPHDLIFSVKGFAQDGAFRPKLQTLRTEATKLMCLCMVQHRTNLSPWESASFQTATVPSSAQRRSHKPGMELAAPRLRGRGG